MMSDRMRTDSPISSRLGPSKIPRVSPSKIEKNNSYSSPPKRSISKLPPSLASRLNVPSSTPPKVSSNQIPKASSPSPVRKIVRNPDGTLQIQMPNQQASPKAVNNNAVASPSKIRSQFTKMYSEVPKNYGGMAKTGVAVSGPSKIHSSFIQNPVADSSLMQQSKVHRQVGLKISNLNWKTTADDIRIAFSEFGQLVSWVIQTPINNVMVAEVVFEKQEDAEKAYAEYNNQIVDGNVLKIEFIKSIIRQRDGMVGIGSIGGQESYPMEDLAMPSQPVVSRQFEPVKPVEKPIQKPKVVRGRGAKHNSKSGMYSDHIMSGRPLVSKASQNAQVVLVRKALDDMEGVETTFKDAPEPKASLFSKLTFGWVNPLIERTKVKVINESDIWELEDEQKTRTVIEEFQVSKKSYKGLVLRLIHVNFGLLCIQIALSSISSLLVFAGPFFLNRIILFIQNDADDQLEQGRYWGIVYVFALLLSNLLDSFLEGQIGILARKIGIRIRAAVISEVYQKSLTCVLDNGGKNADGSSDSKDSLTGNIQTIMSVDAERLREFNVFLPFLIFSPPKCIICIIGLVYVLGWRAALGGVTMMIALIPMIIYTGKITSGIQAKVIGFTDKRVGLLNEVLQGISIVKSFAWESKFIESITHLRQLELNQIINLNYIGAFGHISWHCTPILVSIATFYIYAKLDPNSPKLDAAAAFTAIALLTFLRLPMIELPFVFVKLWEAGVSVNRIEEFLARPDVDKVKRESKEVGFASGNGLGVVDGNFTWTLSQDKNESADETTPLLRTDSKVNGLTRSSFALQNLNLKFKENGLTAIFGATGAGKSSLLQALLGEMTQISGTVNLPRKNVAYVSQTAFISNATIRENILFGEEYDEVRFKSVISACALEKDLEVLASSYKKHHAASEDLSADFIEIGEKGIGLSGGQKQRISLARAAYSKAQYILLDDCLSAVDPPTAKHIFEKCILQFMHGRTRVLATHAVDLVTPEADMVIILRDGVATVEDVQQSKRNSSIPKLLTSFDVEGASSWSAENSTATDETKKQLGKMIQKEEAEEGAVAFSVYRSYMTAASGGKSLSKDSPLTIKSLIRPVSFMTAFLFTLFLFRFFTIVNDYWLREWARAYDGETTSNGNLNVFQAHILAGEVFSPGMVLKNAMGADLLTQMGHYLPDGSVDVDYYINVYLMLGIILLVCIMGPYCVRQTGAYYASKTLHARLLSRVLHAPLRFFSITPIGRIINRFSSDISTLDFQPMLAIEAVSDHSFVVFGVLAVVGYVAPISLLGVIPVAYFYFVVVKGYLNAARQLKRMDSISRSPIYALFTETLTGSPTIRAYDQESRFSKEEEKRVDENNKYFYYMFAATAWLSLNLNIMASFVVFFTGIGIIFTATKFVLEEPIIDAGLSGLALAYTLTLVTELLWLVRFYGMLELSMNAVERVYEYMEIEQEPQGIIDSNRPPANWPERGEIVVKNLVVKYAPETPDNTRNPAILNGISFNVQSFQKVGIIGRTGAGKSTLSLALLRLIPIIDGSVVIDGIDITKIGVKDLRSRITIIPQDPVLFSGTVRSNLDPFEECDDATLYHALKSVHFMDTIAESDYDNGKFNLDHVVSENGGNFSQGQRQLLCLARAMLRNSRVIIMDEATASVDSETDKRIQETIRQPPFSTTTTILIIAHRLKTIADSDKLLVLDKGRISEMGSPKELVGKKGIFRNMCEESGEFDKIMEIIERKK